MNVTKPGQLLCHPGWKMPENGLVSLAQKTVHMRSAQVCFQRSTLQQTHFNPNLAHRILMMTTPMSSLSKGEMWSGSLWLEWKPKEYQIYRTRHGQQWPIYFDNIQIRFHNGNRFKCDINVSTTFGWHKAAFEPWTSPLNRVPYFHETTPNVLDFINLDRTWFLGWINAQSKACAG